MDYLDATELGQLSCLPSDMLAQIDPAIVAANITAVSRLFDSYAAARFAVPFASVGLDVKAACANVCGYWLAARFGYDPNDGPDENFRTRHNAAMRWFESVADGTVTPAQSDPGADFISGVYSEEPRGL